MASEVDIANLALAHLGDSATVASLNPPEGSMQAEHCARFYPIARDGLLEMHPWNFATRRTVLAELGSPPDAWLYAYARPTNVLKMLGVLAPSQANWDDPQEYESETTSTGVPVIYTNTEDASALYITRVTDTNRFSPLFVTALGWYLASMLAGPVMKGEAGAAESKRCLQMMNVFLAQARTADANQREVRPDHTPIWISGR